MSAVRACQRCKFTTSSPVDELPCCPNDLSALVVAARIDLDELERKAHDARFSVSGYEDFLHNGSPLPSVVLAGERQKLLPFDRANYEAIRVRLADEGYFVLDHVMQSALAEIDRLSFEAQRRSAHEFERGLQEAQRDRENVFLIEIAEAEGPVTEHELAALARTTSDEDGPFAYLDNGDYRVLVQRLARELESLRSSETQRRIDESVDGVQRVVASVVEERDAAIRERDMAHREILRVQELVKRIIEGRTLA